MDANTQIKCSIEETIRLFRGKGKSVILYSLLDGEMRFSEIQKQLHPVSQRVLTKQLRELEAEGLIEREVYPKSPPHVGYRLSEKGRSLEDIMRKLREWGTANLDLRH